MAVTLDSVKNLPNQYKFLIILGVMVGIAAGYYFGIYTGKKEELRTSKEELKQVERKRDELESVRNEIEKYEEELALLEADLARLVRRIPTESEIPKILAEIDGEGRKSGLEIIVFQPAGEAKVNEDYWEVKSSVHVKGTYHSFGLFLDKLRQLDRIFSVRNIVMKEIGVENNEVILDITCSIVTFRFNPEQ